MNGLRQSAQSKLDAMYTDFQDKIQISNFVAECLAWLLRIRSATPLSEEEHRAVIDVISDLVAKLEKWPGNRSLAIH